MTPVGSGWAVARTPAITDRFSGTTHAADLYTTMRCSNCQGDSIARREIQVQAHVDVGNMSDMAAEWRHQSPEDWAPKWVEGQDFDYAPAHIASVASEAFQCLSVGAYMSAILMARTAIEAAAKDKGVTTGTLNEKIEELANQGAIRAVIKDAAHNVRRFGNDMAHGDIQVEVTEEDAQQVLQLLDFILQDLYQVQSMMSKVGISIDNRKSSGSTTATP